MKPVTILTPRLSLRPALPEDADAFGEAICENFDDPFFWFDAACLQPGWRADYLHEKRRDFLDGVDLGFFVFKRDTGQLIGGAGLHPADATEGHFGLSYWIRAGSAGQGNGGEAANALVRFAFTHLRARSVGIGYAEGNQGSRAIIRKLGFSRYARESGGYAMPDGRKVDAEIFRRTGIGGLPSLDVNWTFE